MKDQAIQFLREEGILSEDASNFVITFEDKREVEVVDLLERFALSLQPPERAAGYMSGKMGQKPADPTGTGKY